MILFYKTFSFVFPRYNAYVIIHTLIFIKSEIISLINEIKKKVIHCNYRKILKWQHCVSISAQTVVMLRWSSLLIGSWMLHDVIWLSTLCSLVSAYCCWTNVFAYADFHLWCICCELHDDYQSV